MVAVVVVCEHFAHYFVCGCKSSGLVEAVAFAVCDAVEENGQFEPGLRGSTLVA